MNEIKIMGNLGRDPELRYTQQGTPVLNFSLAYNEKQKGGEKKTHWFKILAWSKTAERFGQVLKKGDRVIVSGRVLNNSWTDKEGAVRLETQIHAAQIYPVTFPKDGPTAPEQEEDFFGHS